MGRGKEGSFELWRQDDNGNSFLVGRFSDHEDAEQRLAELTRYPHKQIYWITGQPEKVVSGA